MNIRAKTWLVLLGALSLTACSVAPRQQATPEPVDEASVMVEPKSAVQSRLDLLKQAAQHIQEERWKQAESLYGEILDVDPGHAGALKGLARSYQKQGKTSEAGWTYEILLRLHPEDQQVLQSYGQYLLKTRQPDKLISLLQPAFQSARTLPARSYSLYGIAHDMLGRHEEADRIYRQGLDKNSQSLPLRNNLAFCMILQGRYHYAAIILEDVAQADVQHREHSLYRQNLSLAWALKGRPEKARTAISPVLNPAALETNISYYNWLKTLSRPERRDALLQLL